jgi:hypothetical protein
MTGLRCSRCGKPICPLCAVRTPVGLRCPDCAGVRGLPSYRTPSTDLAKSVGLGLAIAVAVAVVWRFFPDWEFYLCLLLGFGAVETMARAANYKRGVDLQAAAIGVVIVGMVLARVLVAQRFGISLSDVNNLNDLVATQAAYREYGIVSVATILQLKLIPDLIYAAIPVAIAWYRFR